MEIVGDTSCLFHLLLDGASRPPFFLLATYLHLPFCATELSVDLPHCLMSRCVSAFSHTQPLHCSPAVVFSSASDINCDHMKCVRTCQVKCRGPHTPSTIIRSGCSTCPRHVSTNAASSAPSTTR